MQDLAHQAEQLDTEARTRAVRELVRLLQDDPKPNVRAACAVALADLRASEAVPQLLVAVEDPHGHVRQMALSALGEIGESSARPRIERALGDERAEVRYQAIIAFSRLTPQPEQLWPALQARLDDADEAIRYIALRLAEERFLAEKDTEIAAELSATAELAPWRAALQSAAHDKLQDLSAEVALAAAIVLVKLDDARGWPVIGEVIEHGRLARGAVAKEDEAEAIELAGRHGRRELSLALARRAFGLGRFLRDTCALSAKVALTRMGDERAEASLIEDLHSRSIERRTLATVAAGRCRSAAVLQALRNPQKPLDPELAAQAEAQLVRDLAQTD